MFASAEETGKVSTAGGNVENAVLCDTYMPCPSLGHSQSNPLPTQLPTKERMRVGPYCVACVR